MSFECAECGFEESKWMGRCPRCNEWNTFVEVEKMTAGSTKTSQKVMLKTEPVLLSGIETSEKNRMMSGWNGLDRVVGGGLVKGEVILLGGAPGIGKSTIFLQLAEKLSENGHKVFYVSGEENPAQLKIHAQRLGIKGKGIKVLGSGNIDEVEKIANEDKPEVIFVDSIQAVVDPGESGTAGSLKQVRTTGQKLAVLAKNTGSVMLISGQITKQGDIAGPKVLEHMVDAVLYMDALDDSIRVLTSTKNRFGPCGEFALYSMEGAGLVETEDAFAGIKNKKALGESVSCIRTGTRLVPIEFQALAVKSYFEYPLRRSSGFSRERLLMLTAIAEKHLGVSLGGYDLYLNVSGINSVDERTSDLSVIASIYSAVKGRPIGSDMLFMSEVTLNGELKPLRDASERIKFAEKHGFKNVVLAKTKKAASKSNIGLSSISNIKELESLI